MPVGAVSPEARDAASLTGGAVVSRGTGTAGSTPVNTTSMCLTLKKMTMLRTMTATTASIVTNLKPKFVL